MLAILTILHSTIRKRINWGKNKSEKRGKCIRKGRKEAGKVQKTEK